MPCYSALKGFKSRHTNGLTFKREESNGFKMEVACGQCLGCRLDRSRMWAMRIVHEAAQYEDNAFVTLTYREKANATPEQIAKGHYCPEDGSLNKKHFQKFMKRLRKYFSGRNIRYYHCGEYGDQYDRPHYHACLFNTHFPDQELFNDREGNFLFTSKILEKLWPYGFSTIGELTFESAAYTARYILKKILGRNADDHYLRCDEYGVAYWLQPEYTTMSRRPGIGKEWYEEYKDDIWPADEVPVPGSGVYKKVPRYYETILKSEDPDQLEEIKQLRRQFMLAHKEEYSPQRIWQKYKVKKAQVTQLKREML